MQLPVGRNPIGRESDPLLLIHPVITPIPFTPQAATFLMDDVVWAAAMPESIKDECGTPKAKGAQNRLQPAQVFREPHLVAQKIHILSDSYNRALWRGRWLSDLVTRGGGVGVRGTRDRCWQLRKCLVFPVKLNVGP